MSMYTEFESMSYRYTLEEIIQFSNDKIINFAVTSLAWNTVNEVIASYLLILMIRKIFF